MPAPLDDLQKIVALSKRRGFVFQSAEIYGGIANAWDYGPLGVLMKNNVKDAWIRANVQLRDDVEMLDAAERVIPALTPENLVDSTPAMRRVQ